ncbi:tyrosine-type recombinase/integrase [Vibrio gigantis]|uniref:tyrosine-type recombinase/integrase n=1 Tax=Vibrio gigantis TaxID=296199 RepID=UPI001E5B1FC4|nr:tyrosine-type recombinase/integrase [Vibrio gigantis]
MQHRCSYQPRHTYACWLITKGANLSFIAEQMGHTSTMMLERVYGKFMESHAHDQIKWLNIIIK